MQPVRLVVAANDGAIPPFLVTRLERRDLPADERLGRGGTDTRRPDAHQRAHFHTGLGEEVVLRVVEDHGEHIGKMAVVVDHHAREPRSQAVGKRAAIDVDARPARQRIGGHCVAADWGSGGMSSVVPGATRSGSSIPFASANTLQSPGLPYSAYETEWSVSPAETTCTRRPEIPPDVGFVKGTGNGFSVIEMLASTRSGSPSSPNFLYLRVSREMTPTNSRLRQMN